MLFRSYTYGKHTYLGLIPLNALLTLSSWILTFLSYERYRSIVLPFTRRVRKRVYALICFVIYICMYVYHLIQFLWDLSLLSRNFYYGLRIIGDSVLPTISMYIFYFKMSKVLTAQTLAQDSSQENLQLQRHQVALKTLKSLLAIFTVCVFTIRVLTFTMIFVVVNNKQILGYQYYWLIIHVADFLLLINNIANVFVCSWKIKDFRKFI